MPTPFWSVTLKFTTGGLLTLAPVMLIVRADAALGGLLAGGGANVELEPPPPPPQAASVNASKPAARPRSAFPLWGTKSIQRDDVLCLFMTTLLDDDKLLNPPE